MSWFWNAFFDFWTRKQAWIHVGVVVLLWAIILGLLHLL